MKKIEILTPPIVSKSNQGYAIYVEGKKVWESTNRFSSPKGEKIRVDDLLSALGFKLHVVEITDQVIDDNYGIFPDELEELEKYSNEEKFQEEKIEKEKVFAGDEYDFDSIYFPEDGDDLEQNDARAYEDSEYDLPDFESPDGVEWIDIESHFRDEDEDN